MPAWCVASILLQNSSPSQPALCFTPSSQHSPAEVLALKSVVGRGGSFKQHGPPSCSTRVGSASAASRCSGELPSEVLSSLPGALGIRMIIIRAKCQDRGHPQACHGVPRSHGPGWSPKPEQLSTLLSHRSPPSLEICPVTGRTVLELFRCRNCCHQP